MLLACTLIWPNLSTRLSITDNTIYYLVIFLSFFFLVVRKTRRLLENCHEEEMNNIFLSSCHDSGLRVIVIDG